MRPNKEDRKKFDLDLEYGQIREDKIADIFSKAKIEYECYGKPSGIKATESDYWFHNLCIGDNIFCSLVFDTKVLKKLVDKLDTFRTVSGGDNNASKMYLVNLPKLFSSDVIKAFKELENEKENS